MGQNEKLPWNVEAETELEVMIADLLLLGCQILQEYNHPLSPYFRGMLEPEEPETQIVS